MLRIAICEDNPVHADKISAMTADILKVPFECRTFSSGVNFGETCSKEHYPFDIIFMDISLEKDSPSGIELAQDINLLNPTAQIIFTSQHLKYATPVYETRHVYFLCKDELELYLEKALLSALDNLKNADKDILYFKSHMTQYKIAQNDILYCERILRTTNIHTKDTVYKVPYRFSDLTPQLSSRFVLCHRSFLVNMSYVTALNRNSLILSNNEEIPVSRTYYAELKRIFAQI